MKHTVKGYVTYERSPYTNKPEISFQAFKPSKNLFPEMVVVCEHSIEVDIPDDFDPRPEQIKNLQEKQQKAAADFQKLCTEIQRQISELQALEHSA